MYFERKFEYFSTERHLWRKNVQWFEFVCCGMCMLTNKTARHFCSVCYRTKYYPIAYTNGHFFKFLIFWMFFLFTHSSKEQHKCISKKIHTAVRWLSTSAQEVLNRPLKMFKCTWEIAIKLLYESACRNQWDQSWQNHRVGCPRKTYDYIVTDVSYFLVLLKQWFTKRDPGIPWGLWSIAKNVKNWFFPVNHSNTSQS